MSSQNTFKRVEIKYLLNSEQKNELAEKMRDRMVPDPHGNATIRNIYYDTPTFLLARRSIEKPKYKEKLRVRSYRRVDLSEPVFVELKKKCKSVVFKRRITLPQGDALDFLGGKDLSEESFEHKKSKPTDRQIAKELRYFRDMYKTLRPVVFLSYDRSAYYGKDDDTFRMTFDQNIMYRTTDLTLESDVYGDLLIEPEESVMEVKISGGMPVWLSRFLSDKQIFKASFSKYGAAYKDMLKKGEIKIGNI